MQERQETRVQSLGWKDPLEEDMATHFSLLAGRIPWTEEPGGLRPMGSQCWTRLKRLSMHSCTYVIELLFNDARKWKTQNWRDWLSLREPSNTTEKEHVDSYNLIDAVLACKLSSGLHLKCPFYCDDSGLYICHIFLTHQISPNTFLIEKGVNWVRSGLETMDKHFGFYSPCHRKPFKRDLMWSIIWTITQDPEVLEVRNRRT